MGETESGLSRTELSQRDNSHLQKLRCPEDPPELESTFVRCAPDCLPPEKIRLPVPVSPIFFQQMKSMTGYGRGETAQDGFKVTVEVTSVNRKQGEVAVNLPRELEALEQRVRDVVNQRISRGRLTVKVSLHAADGAWPGKIRLNVPLAKAYARELDRLAKALKLSGAVTLDVLVRAPGVLQSNDDVDESEALWPPLEKALDKALTDLVKMREREGAHLAKDLQKRIATLRKSVERVTRQAPEVLARYREQLRSRFKSVGLETPAIDDDRLLKEIVYFADRSDISEELTRLQSHFKQFDDCLKSREPVGRTLDFLSQEMNREINTVGSKANDSVISREVVMLKAELEKFREQVQNVE